jgi:hypothetical protein
MNREENRLNTADLARMNEYEAPKTGDRVINRGDIPPKPHEQNYPSRTEQAEALWDESAQGPVRENKAPAEPQRRTTSDVARERSAVTKEDVRLFGDSDLADMRRRWSDVQAGFVDEPRRAVEQADSLVAETMQRLAQTFATAKQNLEHQWDRGDNVTTEDLRVTLQRYRAFFDRLLSM